MNHIFKIVWSRTLGRLVVTSELSRSRVAGSSRGTGQVKAPRRSSSGPAHLGAWALAVHAALLTLGYAPAALADECLLNDSGDNGGSNGSGFSSLACGHLNSAGGDGATAVGTNNNASNTNATVVGLSNQAAGERSSALGVTNRATGDDSSAFGFDNQATADISTAVGASNLASGFRSLAVGSNSSAIGTRSTASASELVTNAMLPYVASGRIALVGANTSGKPVGQFAFDLADCDLRIRAVTFQTLNANDEGDYFTGLASVMPNTCRANDDFTRPLGDPAEASIATALDFLAGRSCTPITGGADQSVRSVGGPEIVMPERPSAAQLQIPGLF